MKLSQMSKSLIMMIGFTAIVFIFAGIIFHRSMLALYFAIGVILTSSLNVGKVFLLEKTVDNTLDIKDENAGKNYVKLQFLFRYVLTAAVLLAVGLINIYITPPFISIWGTLAGMFTLQAAVIIVRHRKFDDM